MTPKEASRKENENKVWRNLYPEFGGKTMTAKFSIGDNVRITKKMKTFDKAYTKRWAEEVITISKIQLTIPVTYKITDYNREEIQGSFYEREFQKTKQDICRIEKIIKQQGSKSHVKWLGYHDSFNSLVDNKDINKLQSQCSMFATAWPGFHKYSQVVTPWEIIFINRYHFFFKVNNFHYEPEPAYSYY